MAEGSSSTSTATFHGWKYSHYFVIVQEGEKNLRVRCTLCPGNKTLSSARNTTSNFKKYLNTVHKYTVLVEKKYRGQMKEENERGLTIQKLAKRVNQRNNILWWVWVCHQQDSEIYFQSML